MQMYIRTYISMYVCMYSICRCIMYMFMYIRMYLPMCICVYIQYNSLSNSPVSTWVSIYILLVDTHTPHSVPSSCTPCQPVLVVSTSDIKYRFGVPFKVLSKLGYIYTCIHINVCKYLHMYVCMYLCTYVFKVHTYNTYVYVP